MVGSHSLRGVLAAIVPLVLWGVVAATPVLGQERAAEIKIQTETQETPDVRENQPHPPVPGQAAEADVEIQRDTEGEDKELKVDFDAKGFADVLEVIRQMRMELMQLRRELAEARGDRPPLAERRLGYRQDGEARVDNRLDRRSQRIDNRGERRDLRTDNRDDRQDDRRDGDRIEDRGERRDLRTDNRDLRTDNRDLRQDDRRDGDRIENRGERRDDRQDNRTDRRDDRQDNREDRRDDRGDDDDATDATTAPATPAPVEP